MIPKTAGLYPALGGGREAYTSLNCIGTNHEPQLIATPRAHCVYKSWLDRRLCRRRMKSVGGYALSRVRAPLIDFEFGSEPVLQFVPGLKTAPFGPIVSGLRNQIAPLR